MLQDITPVAKMRVNGHKSYICPFCGHGSHGDGIAVNPRGNNYSLQCFGCDFSGDIIKIYQEKYETDFNSAFAMLADKLGLSVDKMSSKDFSSTVDRKKKNENPLDTIDDFEPVEKARKFAKRNKIDLVVFDLWQLYQVVNLAKNDHDNRLSELQLFKQLALVLDCPVLLLSLIEITAEMREASIPDVNDLKYADIIDETADTILLMYREKYYIPDSDDDSVMIEIVKNKDYCRHFVRISGNADGSFRSGLTND